MTEEQERYNTGATGSDAAAETYARMRDALPVIETAQAYQEAVRLLDALEGMVLAWEDTHPF